MWFIFTSHKDYVVGALVKYKIAIYNLLKTHISDIFGRGRQEPADIISRSINTLNMLIVSVSIRTGTSKRASMWNITALNRLTLVPSSLHPSKPLDPSMTSWMPIVVSIFELFDWRYYFVVQKRAQLFASECKQLILWDVFLVNSSVKLLSKLVSFLLRTFLLQEIKMFVVYKVASSCKYVLLGDRNALLCLLISSKCV